METLTPVPMAPPRLMRPLIAIWVSLGLHAALIALVHVAPATTTGASTSSIEARLVSLPATSSATDASSETESVLAASELAEAVPVLTPAAMPYAEPPVPVETEVATVTPPPLPVAPPPPTAPLVIASPVDLNYYRAREVDVHPRALRDIEPIYPPAADRNRESGTVRLQLKLEADGRVTDVDVINSTPPGVFDEAAVEAFKHAEFAPAFKAGRPVRALILIEVNFDWEGRPR